MYDVDVFGHFYLQNINGKRNVVGKDQRSKLMAILALIGIIDQADIGTMTNDASAFTLPVVSRVFGSILCITGVSVNV